MFVENKMYKVNITGFMKTVSKNSRPDLAFFSSSVDDKKFKGVSACFSVFCLFIVRSCDDPIGRLQLKVAEHSFQEPMPNSP